MRRRCQRKQAVFTPLQFLPFLHPLLVPGDLFAGPVTRGRRSRPAPLLPSLFTLSGNLRAALPQLFGGLLAPPFLD